MGARFWGYIRLLTVQFCAVVTPGRDGKSSNALPNSTKSGNCAEFTPV